jgi:hypothetical protein
MKTVKESLTTILSDIQKLLPPLLEAKKIKQFDGYSIGFPVNPEKLLLCVRLASFADDTSNTLEFDIHAQFPGILEVEVYDYIDAVNDYLNNFDPQIVGFTDGSCSGIVHDKPRTGTVEVFWSVKLTHPKDDCD